MNQYFKENHEVLTHERLIELTLFGKDFTFLSNNGLFSCSKVDTASIILMENIPPLSGKVLDLGCGYGPIGVVMGKTYPIEITMSDINPIAVAYAARNAKQNGVDALCISSDGFGSLPYIYESIILNPPIHAGKDVMYRLYQDAAKHLVTEGSLYIVIQKKHGADSTMKELAKIFKDVHTLYKAKGLYVLKCITH